VTRSDLAEWLLASQGAAALPQFLEWRLLERAARDRDCAVSDTEVDAAFQTEWSTIVKLRFGGDESKFLAELEAGGHSRESYARQRSLAIRAETTLDRLAKHERDVSEAALRQNFEVEYGTPPTRLSVRVIQISKFALEQEAIKEGRARSAGTAEMESNAEKLAKDVLARAKEGTDFASLAKDFSHDTESKRDGGLIRHLTPDRLSAQAYVAAKALSEAAPLSPLIRDSGGFNILRLESRRVVTFEDVASELKERKLAAPVSGTERGECLTRLRQQYTIEVLGKP